MINTSKLALIAVLAAMSVASPAFAQSFNKGDGTGNNLPFAYGPNGTKPAWTVAPQNEQIAVRQSNAGKVAVRQTGHNTFANGIGAQRRPNRPLFQVNDAGRKRSRPQHQGKVAGFLLAAQIGNAALSVF